MRREFQRASPPLSSFVYIVSVYFLSLGWNMPVIIKRLDARYDWLMARWGQMSYKLIDAGDGCNPSSSAAGAVAWVSEGNCSFFTKVCKCHMSVNVIALLLADSARV